MSAMNTASGALGFLVAQIPPYHLRPSGRASVLVLACIDPRFSNDLSWYLTHSWELGGDYDLFCLAGASLGVFHSDCWKEAFTDHLELAKKLHGISEVWVFDHLDCGMYKASLGIEVDEDNGPHLEKIKVLKDWLASTNSSLGFKGYIISLNGFVQRVV